MDAALIGGHLLGFRLQLRRLRCYFSAQFGFERANCASTSSFALRLRMQEVIDGFDANPDGAGGLVFVEILSSALYFS
jgi:hypothetical protein